MQAINEPEIGSYDPTIENAQHFNDEKICNWAQEQINYKQVAANSEIEINKLVESFKEIYEAVLEKKQSGATMKELAMEDFTLPAPFIKGDLMKCLASEKLSVPRSRLYAYLKERDPLVQQNRKLKWDNLERHQKEKNPMLIGPSLSGKSTWVEKTRRNAVVLSRDTIREMWSPSAYLIMRSHMRRIASKTIPSSS